MPATKLHFGIERRLNHSVTLVFGEFGRGFVGRDRIDEGNGRRSESFDGGVQHLARARAYQDLVGSETFARGELGVEGGEFLVVVTVRLADDARHSVDRSLGRSFRELVSVDPNRVGGRCARNRSALCERGLGEAGRYHSCKSSSRKHGVLLSPDLCRYAARHWLPEFARGVWRGGSAMDPDRT